MTQPIGQLLLRSNYLFNTKVSFWNYLIYFSSAPNINLITKGPVNPEKDEDEENYW